MLIYEFSISPFGLLAQISCYQSSCNVFASATDESIDLKKSRPRYTSHSILELLKNNS